MPRGQQANQDAFHDIVLSHDDFGDLPADRVEPVDGELQCRFGSHDFHCRARRTGASVLDGSSVAVKKIGWQAETPAPQTPFPPHCTTASADCGSSLISPKAVSYCVTFCWRTRTSA